MTAAPSPEGDAGAVPRIVITGPGGWIGSAMLAHLARRDGAGWERRVSLYGSTARTLEAPDGTTLPVRPLSEIDADAVRDAVLIHLAYLTKEKAQTLGAERFVETNTAIDRCVAEAADGGPPRALFVASSGAAALAERGEDDHLYGVCKLRQEARFLRLSGARSIPLLAGRIFNIAGPHINKLGSYAIADFLTQAAATDRIRIAATRPVFRSYLHVDDLCALLLVASSYRVGPERPTDLCGAEIVEMADVAAAVAEHMQLGADRIERDPIRDWTPSIYVGASTETRILALRAAIRLRGFASQVADTAKFISALIRYSPFPARSAEPEASTQLR